MWIAKPKQILIVSLGNPGKEYVGTRHNIGFRVLDDFARGLSLVFKTETKFVSELASYDFDGTKVFLVKPNTFMNLSGTAVLKLMSFYKISPEHLLVLHDDVALNLGTLRVSFGRGAGGQHGVEDIINKIGKNFHRIRIGVGPDPGGDKRADYVLGKFPSSAEDTLSKLSLEVEKFIKTYLEGDLKQETKSVES